MENNEQPRFSKKEMLLRLLISGLLLFVSGIGYITILFSEDLKIKNFQVLLGAILTLWSFRGKRVKAFALNLWVMRIGGIGLLLAGIYNFYK